MTSLGSAAGFEVAADDSRIVFIDRGARGLGIAAAVVGGIAGMAWIWTLVFAGLAAAGQGPGWLVVVIVAPLAAGLTLVLRTLLRKRATLRGRPLESITPLLVADLKLGLLADGDGQVLAPLTACRATKAMLITSSAPSVKIRWPGGSREVFRGGLAGGGVADMLDQLHARGFQA
ncbi:MAG: hypothetical protein AAGA54_00715 [Myxococcota bacterium]